MMTIIMMMMMTIIIVIIVSLIPDHLNVELMWILAANRQWFSAMKVVGFEKNVIYWVGL